MTIGLYGEKERSERRRQHLLRRRRDGEKFGFQKGHIRFKNAHTFPSKEKHPNWGGEHASYSAFHKRLYKIKGLPKRCEVCGLQDGNRAYHWANLTGRFFDINDYKRMCCPCHTNYDNSKRTYIKIRKTNTSGITGVSWNRARKKWFIYKTKDHPYMGYFNNLRDAVSILKNQQRIF